ncbi:MAG: hypothetical protein GTO22_12095, partial [Gemmatimonadales bacterium]|nr:hypothetical protein [Gemmatimonadales bacterium]
IEEIEGCSLPGDPASTPPIPLTVGIDMDPTGNSCPGDGVTDCTLGEIDACLETTAGATIQFDVF